MTEARTGRSASTLVTAQLPSAPPAAGGGGPLVVNRYRLHRRVGSGGFGTVWMARDERLERDVAVKVLPRERVVGGRFEREARAAARLAHPGIVTLYEAAVDDEGAYLVSELVRGQTLDQLLQAGRLSDRDVVTLGIALCDALGHAHAQGVVHRDVKPSNVLVPDAPASPAQLAKLTDFGVARVIGGDTLTRAGDVLGTAGYMAPEQAEGREAGAAADLYSLALVLYEALTGINPLRCADPPRARRLAIHLPPVRRYRRDLPRELARGIDLALRPRPRERGSLLELREALRVSLADLDDTPGVIAAPWQASAPVDTEAPPPLPVPDPGLPSAAPIPWPSRALAGVAAGGLCAWLVGDPLGHGSLALLLGLLAAVLVAALPRLGWCILTAGTAGALALSGLQGAALAVCIGLVLPALLMPRSPVRWPLAAAAPALAALGLGGAWPALAARAARAWQRAALGAVGWLWLLLAGPLVGHGLYARLALGTPAPGDWTSSPYEAAHHVLAPLLTAGRLAPAVIWALAAVALPHVVGARAPRARALAALAWAAGAVLATVAALAAGRAGISPGAGAVIIGGLAGALLAFGAGSRSMKPR